MEILLAGPDRSCGPAVARQLIRGADADDVGVDKPTDAGDLASPAEARDPVPARAAGDGGGQEPGRPASGRYPGRSAPPARARGLASFASAGARPRPGEGPDGRTTSPGGIPRCRCWQQ
jgi:hypothetical protein